MLACVIRITLGKCVPKLECRNALFIRVRRHFLRQVDTLINLVLRHQFGNRLDGRCWRWRWWRWCDTRDWWRWRRFFFTA
ncbi:MAG: hypothetical protein EBY29_00910 [Planctomycetes bacterium]|nr:hypothetical protein [Planctomycetota bacterium]